LNSFDTVHIATTQDSNSLQWCMHSVHPYLPWNTPSLSWCVNSIILIRTTVYTTD